jgi:DNA-binding NarL/FixJ family response regulator
VTPLRVAVLDDHPVVRAGVRAIVESAPDLRHVGDAASEEELWPLLRAARAHVLVLDLHHPGRDGLTLAARLSALDVTLRVVLHTALRSDELTVAAALAGVAVTVGKDESPPELLRAIRAASDPVPATSASTSSPAGASWPPLEPPDRAIAAMHLVDTPVSGIAEALRITPRDVRLRIEAMLRRLVPPATASTQPM